MSIPSTGTEEDKTIASAAVTKKAPWGATWRCSSWYTTFVVFFGLFTDVLVYMIIVPVVPFRLEHLGCTNISVLSSWLLVTFTIAIIVVNIPVAYYFHRYPYRRGPLVISVVALAGSLVLFMLVRVYWAMVVARAIQGAASTIIWSVGFALLCENAEEHNKGKMIGFSFTGQAIGNAISPAIGGAMYAKLGWYSPFIFSISVCVIDLVLRLIVLERRHYPELFKPRVDMHIEGGGQRESASWSPIALEEAEPKFVDPPNELSLWGVVVALATSPRGVTACSLMFVYGLVLSAMDPTLTLRLADNWGNSSSFIGLVYLIGAIPTFFAGPVVGHISDKIGSEWLATPILLALIPFTLLFMLKQSLAGFIIVFTCINFCLAGAITLSGVEVAAVAKTLPGISEVHEFAATNIAYAISAALGATAGGQLYPHSSPHSSPGWSAVCWFMFACAVAAIPAPLFFTGDRPIANRLFKRKIPFTNTVLERDLS